MFAIFSLPDLDRQALDADPYPKAYVSDRIRIPPFWQAADIGIWISNIFLRRLYIFRLDLIRARLDLIRARLDLIRARLDLIRTRLDLING
jgi:hypothetical protein